MNNSENLGWSWSAEIIVAKGKAGRSWFSFYYNVLVIPAFTFLWNYIFRFGILDGRVLIDAEDIIGLIDGLMAKLARNILGQELKLPLPRMTYDEAMERFGHDAPDPIRRTAGSERDDGGDWTRRIDLRIGGFEAV